MLMSICLHSGEGWSSLDTRMEKNTRGMGSEWAEGAASYICLPGCRSCRERRARYPGRAAEGRVGILPRGAAVPSASSHTGWMGEPFQVCLCAPTTAQGQRHHPGLSHTSSFLPSMTFEVNLIKSCFLYQNRTWPDPLSRPDVFGLGFWIKPFHTVRAWIWLEVL